MIVFQNTEELEKLKEGRDTSHCSPWDCGTADFYYYRPEDPHYYTEGSKVRGKRITEESMTPEQVADYYAGYKYSEIIGDRKDWR
jgi:hypothetical protein